MKKYILTILFVLALVLGAVAITPIAANRITTATSDAQLQAAISFLGFGSGGGSASSWTNSGVVWSFDPLGRFVGTNTVTGAYSEWRTNGHSLFVDQYRTRWERGTNFTSITYTNGHSLVYSNFVLTVDGAGVVVSNSSPSFTTVFGAFSGSGLALTNVPGTSITGTINQTNLPAAAVTNTETGVTLAGTFSGTGTGLTLSGANLNGQINQTNLPGAAITNTETGVTLNGTFTGSGSGLSGVATSGSGSGVGVTVGAFLSSGVLNVGVTNKYTNVLAVVIGSNHITATLTTNSTGFETLTISDASQTNTCAFTNNAGQVVFTNQANAFAGNFNGSILNSNAIIVTGDPATLNGYYYTTNSFTGRCGDSFVTNVLCYAAGFNDYPSGFRVFLIYTPFTNAIHSLSFATPQWVFVQGSGITIYKYSASILGPYIAVNDAVAINVAYQYTQPPLYDPFGNLNLFGANVFGGHFYGDASTMSNLPLTHVSFGNGNGGDSNFQLGQVGTQSDGRVYFSSLSNFQIQDPGGYWTGTGAGSGDDDFYTCPVDGWYCSVSILRLTDGTTTGNSEGQYTGLPGELDLTAGHDFPGFLYFAANGTRQVSNGVRIFYATAGTHASVVTTSDNGDSASDGSMTIFFLHK